MNPDKRKLIVDLMDEERNARRETTLLAGSRILRRKRWGRVAMPGCVVALLATLLVVSVHRPAKNPTRGKLVAVVRPAPASPDEPRAISDAELLAMFPNTPVALVKLDNGKKRLIFTRPGDEEKFLTKM